MRAQPGRPWGRMWGVRPANVRSAILLTTALLSLVPCVGCREAGHDQPLVVLAASSLREAFDELGAGFEVEHPGVRVELAFSGTQELRAQVEHGARADVFASADLAHMEALVREGLALEPSVFARNIPVVVVAPGAPVRTFADLPSAERIAIGAPEVPIGRYAAAVLDRAQEALGDGFRDRVEARIVSREFNVRQVLAKVELGEAQAGIVYRTDVRDGVSVVPIPEVLAVKPEYPISVLRGAPRPGLAHAFIAWVRSERGRRILVAHGFDVP